MHSSGDLLSETCGSSPHYTQFGVVGGVGNYTLHHVCSVTSTDNSL